MRHLLFAILFLPMAVLAQKIEENKVDDFTHHKIVRTSWDPIIKKFGGSLMAYSRVSKIDSNYWFNFKFMEGTSVMAVSEGGDLMLKTEGDSVITLKNIKYQISCTGCGAIGINGSGLQGLDLDFVLKKEQYSYLQHHKVIKIRIYTTDGYLEDEVKDKFAAIFIAQLNLVK